MSMSRLVVVLAMVSGIGVPAFGQEVGQEAPEFTLVSGDGEQLSRGDLLGRVTVMYYETRDTKDNNRDLKKSIREWRDELPEEQRERVFLVPVIDGSSATWLTREIWNGKLVDKSRQTGVTVYGDWDGAMRGSFELVKDDSNILVIDSGAIIRDRRQGIVDAAEIEAFRELLTGLLAR